ncbi:glycosyltransferase family 4 protein [Gudongella oleilytica]|jgi:glycosyltransferase involved in cell wall biosynthesis|uniref:glycosyltransferase family 4 protein n=1 Tax=Gudongella oleilytica TaxID=1582259 RepID=UPI002A362D98|nr:glycosyltransferase family 4 protein [Gudongella oleilytica]MDY0257241.1 glycosyltransferase family 4 protein [Gudongella oleilytica]
MKVLVICNEYPEENNLYRNGFVHRRVVNYKQSGLDSKVFVFSEESTREYEFDGVNVTTGNMQIYKNLVEFYNPDIILVHFIQKSTIDLLNSTNQNIPVIIWVHGVEALAWFRRLFNFKDFDFIKYIVRNTIQLFRLRNFIKDNPNKYWVFVSEWMKQIAEMDTFSTIKNYRIIPNVVDEKIFSYKEKKIEDRYRILLIRPFMSRKYANDISVKAIVELSRRKDFDKFQITIVGSGPLFNSTIRPLRKYDNVEIVNKFLKQEEIKVLHDQNGIFLCPTRQDAQGVSMCEAMSSGLVPISSNNTAIPEYVNNLRTGLLSVNKPLEVAKNIERLIDDENLFLELSYNASTDIQSKCSSGVVIKKEIDLMEHVISVKYGGKI